MKFTQHRNEREGNQKNSIKEKIKNTWKNGMFCRKGTSTQDTITILLELIWTS